VVNAVRGYYINYEDGVEVYNNVAFNCGIGYRTSRNLPPGTYFAVDMKNNISYNPGNAHIEFISGTTPMNSDYNLFYPDSELLYFIPVAGTTGANLTTWQTYSYPNCVFDPNSNTGDPLFENASGTFSEPEDFKLTASSPAINAGTNVGLTTDYAGNPIVGTPDIGAYEFQSPLAVEYLSPLRAFPKDNSVMLSWTSVNEQNNDYFLVQRSLDGRIWKDIGKVEGKGNTLSSRSYKMVDLKPENGTLYYRLKQYDYDGVFSYSNIASVRFEKTDFNIYPNPTSGRLEIVFPGNINGEIQVFNILGKSVFYKNINGVRADLNLSHLPGGTYFIGIDTKDGLATEKIVLQK
ncbi:MAG TPA: T9SS type A sorting domain-containing protein, partial [Bacteroidetes bacterium]|nr:T9SS type A sorting domain-containing protein [Bacteroidota bacterium]